MTKKTRTLGVLTIVAVLTIGVLLTISNQSKDNENIQGAKEVVINQTNEKEEQVIPKPVIPIEIEQPSEVKQEQQEKKGVDKDNEKTETQQPAQIRDYSYLTFDEAYAAARSEIGEGKTFIWNGKQYTTEYQHIDKLPPTKYDELPFEEAIAKAERDLGKNQTFGWGGYSYSTNYTSYGDAIFSLEAIAPTSSSDRAKAKELLDDGLSIPLMNAISETRIFDYYKNFLVDAGWFDYEGWGTVWVRVPPTDPARSYQHYEFEFMVFYVVNDDGSYETTVEGIEGNNIEELIAKIPPENMTQDIRDFFVDSTFTDYHLDLAIEKYGY